MALPDRGKSDADGVEEARRLHAQGYTTRAVHAHWVLAAYKVLHGHLTEDGEPLTDSGDFDTSFYLTPAEWREVRAAAQTITDLSACIAVDLELANDPG